MTKRTKKTVTKTCKNCKHLQGDGVTPGGKPLWKCDQGYQEKGDDKASPFDHNTDEAAQESSARCIHWLQKSDDDAILEKLGMSKLRKEEPPPANEPLRQEQLLEAYRDRAAILERLNGYNPKVDRFKSEKDVIRRRMTVIDELFQKAPQDVQKYLIEVRDGLEKRLAEMAETKIRESQEHEADAKKLKAVNARINRLHTVGPDLQEHFDMNENE